MVWRGTFDVPTFPNAAPAWSNAEHRNHSMRLDLQPSGAHYRCASDVARSARVAITFTQSSRACTKLGVCHVDHTTGCLQRRRRCVGS